MPLDNMAPGMGITYADLARMQKPEIPGMGLRPGLSAGAGVNYAQDEQAFKGMLNQMAPQAELNQQAQAMATQEYMGGAEARGLHRERSMQDDRDALELSRSEAGIKTKIAEAVAKLDAAKRKALEAKSHVFAQIAKANPEEVPMILDYYGDEAVYNGKDLRKFKPEQAITLSQGITEGLKMTPKYQQAMDVQSKKNEGFANKASIDAASRERVEAIRAQVKTELGKLASKDRAARLAVHKGGTDTLLAKMIEDLTANGGLSLTEALTEVQPFVEKIKEIKREARPDISSLFSARPNTSTKETPNLDTTKTDTVTIGGKQYKVIKENGREYVMDGNEKKPIVRK